MAKNSFVLYTDYAPQVEMLSMEQRGVLFTAILRYVEGEELPDMDPVVKMAFGFIRSSLDRDAQKWEDVRDKRREAGRKGGKANQANASFAKQNQANQAVNVSVNANDNVNDNVNVNVPTAGAVLGTKMVRSKNRFSNYEQNKYDLESLERILTNE